MHFINSVENGTTCHILIFSGDFLDSIFARAQFYSPCVTSGELLSYNMDIKGLIGFIADELKEKKSFAEREHSSSTHSIFCSVCTSFQPRQTINRNKIK